MKSAWRFVVVFGAGLGLTAYTRLPEFFTSNQRALEVAHATLPRIGEALMIAMILAFVVDRAAKEQLLKDFAQEVSVHIVGRLLPPELREYILSYLKVDLIRSEWNVRYTIEPWVDKPNLLKLTTYSCFVLENRSEAEVEHAFEFEVDKSAHPEVGESRILRARCTQHNRTVFDHEDNVGHSDKGKMKFVSEKHYIPAKSQSTYLAESVECFSNDYNGEFIAKVPCLRTTVTVLYPKDTMKVDLVLSFEGRVDRIELANGTEWKINTPMLPGHTFTTTWETLGKAAVATASA
jgi:hypothetical protein